MESDDYYFARRAEEERAAAERTSDPVARRAHLELAAAYQRRSASARAKQSASVPRNLLRIRPAAE